MPELPGSLKRKLNLWVITCWYSKTNNLACPWITNKIHLWGGFCVCTYGFSLPTKTPVLVVVIQQVCYNSQYYQPACSPSSHLQHKTTTTTAYFLNNYIECKGSYSQSKKRIKHWTDKKGLQMKHQQFTRLSKVLQPTEGNIIQVQEELGTDLIQVLICTQTGSDNNEKDMIPSNKGANSIRRNSQIKIFFLSCFFFWGCVGRSRSGVGIFDTRKSCNSPFVCCLYLRFLSMFPMLVLVSRMKMLTVWPPSCKRHDTLGIQLPIICWSQVLAAACCIVFIPHDEQQSRAEREEEEAHTTWNDNAKFKATAAFKNFLIIIIRLKSLQSMHYPPTHGSWSPISLCLCEKYWSAKFQTTKWVAERRKKGKELISLLKISPTSQQILVSWNRRCLGKSPRHFQTPCSLTLTCVQRTIAAEKERMQQ